MPPGAMAKCKLKRLLTEPIARPQEQVRTVPRSTVPGECPWKSKGTRAWKCQYATASISGRCDRRHTKARVPQGCLLASVPDQRLVNERVGAVYFAELDHDDMYVVLVLPAFVRGEMHRCESISCSGSAVGQNRGRYLGSTRVVHALEPVQVEPEASTTALE